MFPPKTSSSRKPLSLNKLSFRGRLWIASDIHLSPDAPATAAAFHDFLDRAARQADHLILAGDIFDAWIGDDVALCDPPPWLQASLLALQQTARRTPLWIGRGNRDFLMGAALLRHVGAHALPEPALLDTDAGSILLAHGDEYCTADHNYQRLRRLVRRPVVQRGYLALPLSVRKRIAEWARGRSMHSNQYKDRRIMDVEPAAVMQALLEAKTTLLIHGHTHRPGRYPLPDAPGHERVVIPDWDFDHTPTPRGGWVSVDASGVEIKIELAAAVAL